MKQTVQRVDDVLLAVSLAYVSQAIGERKGYDLLYSYLDVLRNELLGVDDLETILDRIPYE